MQRKRKKKIGYYLSFALIMLSGAAALFIGTAVVSVNCHNTVSASPIVLFDIERSGGGTVVTVMGKEYVFEGSEKERE